MEYNIIEVSELKLDRIEQIELFENFGNGYPLDKESRNTHGIIYQLDASSRIILGGKLYKITSGDVYFFRQHEKYRVELPDNYTKSYVIDFLGEYDGDFMVIHGCEDMLPLFEEAERLWRRHREDEYFRLDCMALTYRIFAELCRRRDRIGQPLRKKERLKPVLERIHRDYGSSELKISDLAELVGMGERNLCKSFCEVYGSSPKRYLTDLRMKRAKELLRVDHTVTEVARMVGFRDVYHFSTCFKKEFGISPLGYRSGQNPDKK